MKEKLQRAWTLLRFGIYSRVAALFTPIEKDKVLFLSETYGLLDGNLKAVYDALDASFQKKVYASTAHGAAQDPALRRALWRDIVTAKYLVLDDFYDLISALPLRPGQQILQLWHGCGAYKKFGFSRRESGDHIRHVHRGYRKYSRVSVTAEAIRSCYAEAFDLPEERIVAAGSPRTDVFFQPERQEIAKERVYRAFPQLRGKRVVLIAPTYRGRRVEEADYPFASLRLPELAAMLGAEYQIVIRWHPALYHRIERGLCDPGIDGLSRVLDTSTYEDVNALLMVSDVLVTDYSSLIFDYFLTAKPVVYFTPDREDYEHSRGLYFPFEDYVYGAVAEDAEALCRAIRAEALCEDRREAFREKFMSACDGYATERVCAWFQK